MAQNDLADPKRIGKKALEERMARRQELSDVGIILSTREGRRFYWRLLGAGHIFHSTFTGNNTTFFNEGKREVMLPFLADSQRYPVLYLEMVKENTPPEEPPKPDDREQTL